MRVLSKVANSLLSGFNKMKCHSSFLCGKTEKTSGHSEGRADFFVLSQWTSLKLCRDCCLVCRCTTIGLSSKGAPSQHCRKRCIHLMALEKWLHPYGDVAKGIWALVRVMNFYENSSQLVYECKFPVKLAQSWWQRPGSSINSSGPQWYTAVLHPWNQPWDSTDLPSLPGQKREAGGGYV